MADSKNVAIVAGVAVVGVAAYLIVKALLDKASEAAAAVSDTVKGAAEAVAPGDVTKLPGPKLVESGPSPENGVQPRPGDAYLGSRFIQPVNNGSVGRPLFRSYYNAQILIRCVGGGRLTVRIDITETAQVSGEVTNKQFNEFLDCKPGDNIFNITLPTGGQFGAVTARAVFAVSGYREDEIVYTIE